MTIDQIKSSDRPYLTASDVADVLHCDPQTLRYQAQKNVSQLGFPASVAGKRLRIPRKPFLEWLDEA